MWHQFFQEFHQKNTYGNLFTLNPLIMDKRVAPTFSIMITVEKLPELLNFDRMNYKVHSRIPVFECL